jgi:hypothetical protein
MSKMSGRQMDTVLYPFTERTMPALSPEKMPAVPK